MYFKMPFVSEQSRYRDEKRKLIIRHIVHGVILCLLLLSPLLYEMIQAAVTPEEPPLPELELISSDGLVTDEYEYLEQCRCELTLTFNYPVESGKATVAFYDEANDLIETKTFSLYPESSNQKLAKGSVTVNGLVDRYRILDCDFAPCIEPEDNTSDAVFGLLYAVFIVYGLLFGFPFWIRNFTCKCREYTVDGHRILVYAGHSHFYIKVDGEKYDEVVRFALFSSTRLRTTLENGMILEATVTATFKRIRFKCNDRLVEPD